MDGRRKRRSIVSGKMKIKPNWTDKNTIATKNKQNLLDQIYRNIKEKKARAVFIQL